MIATLTFERFDVRLVIHGKAVFDKTFYNIDFHGIDDQLLTQEAVGGVSSL